MTEMYPEQPVPAEQVLKHLRGEWSDQAMADQREQHDVPGPAYHGPDCDLTDHDRWSCSDPTERDRAAAARNLELHDLAQRQPPEQHDAAARLGDLEHGVYRPPLPPHRWQNPDHWVSQLMPAPEQSVMLSGQRHREVTDSKPELGVPRDCPCNDIIAGLRADLREARARNVVLEGTVAALEGGLQRAARELHDAKAVMWWKGSS